MGSLPQLFAIQCLADEYITVATTEGSCCLMPSTNASVLDSIARFAVEPASDGLVHIKSCYNNKYLVCRESKVPAPMKHCELPDVKSGKIMLIVAAASEREENTSYSDCTLFRAEFYQDGKVAKFLHRGSNDYEYYVCHGPHGWPLFLSQYIAAGKFGITDAEATVRLPKRVSFKADNGKFLCHDIDGGVPYNSFTGDDNKEEVSHYEIFQNRRAEIRIKSLHNKKFLRCDNSGWVVADVDSEKGDPNETFKAVKVGDNVIALRNGHGQLFKRVEDQYGKSWLKACDESDVVHQGRFVVGEPVFKRKINVQFQFNDATIYGKEVSQTAAVSVVNETDEKHELSQGFSYTKTHTATWGSSDQFETGVEATLTAGVPFIVKESIKVKTGYTRNWSRGTTDDYSKQLTSTYTVPVPAKTKVTVNLISEEARYDIPYSYYQSDTYTNGEKFTTFMNDGIYHGVEAYNFYYQPEYESLTPDSDENVLTIAPNSDNKIIIPPTLPKRLGDSHPDNKIVIIKSKEPPVTPPS